MLGPATRFDPGLHLRHSSREIACPAATSLSRHGTVQSSTCHVLHLASPSSWPNDLGRVAGVHALVNQRRPASRDRAPDPRIATHRRCRARRSSAYSSSTVHHCGMSATAAVVPPSLNKPGGEASGTLADHPGESSMATVPSATAALTTLASRLAFLAPEVRQTLRLFGFPC